MKACTNRDLEGVSAIDPVRHLRCDVRHERSPTAPGRRPVERPPDTRRTRARRPLGQYRPKATNNASFANWRGHKRSPERARAMRGNGGDITVGLAVPWIRQASGSFSAPPPPRVVDMATWTNQPAPTATPSGVPQVAPGPPPARTWIGRVLHQLLVDTTYTLLIGLPLAIISFSSHDHRRGAVGRIDGHHARHSGAGRHAAHGSRPGRPAPGEPRQRRCTARHRARIIRSPSRVAAGAGCSPRSATRSRGSISWPGSSICPSRSSRSS